MKIKIISFLVSMFITMAIFILIETLFFKENFTRALVLAVPAGLGSAIGMRIYISYLKRKAIKQSN